MADSYEPTKAMREEADRISELGTGDEQVEAMKAMNKRMALQLLGLDEVAGAGPEPPAD